MDIWKVLKWPVQLYNSIKILNKDKNKLEHYLSRIDMFNRLMLNTVLI